MNPPTRDFEQGQFEVTAEVASGTGTPTTKHTRFWLVHAMPGPPFLHRLIDTEILGAASPGNLQALATELVTRCPTRAS